MLTSETPSTLLPVGDGNSIEVTKIVVGIDNVRAYQPIVPLLARLEFSNAQATLIHSAPNRLPFAPTLGNVEGIEERYAEATGNLGQAALLEAGELFLANNIPNEILLTHGHAAERLIEEAEALNADLIAVNGMRVDLVGANAIGSVSAGIALATKQSVLISKGTREIGKRFRAVFATDHSPFAGRCLERFLQLAPEGIAEIMVVSAWEIEDDEAEHLGKTLAMDLAGVDRWIDESVEQNNQKVCRALEAAGYVARSKVSKGKAKALIEETMADLAADLLIVGAQGSGAMSRSMMGSVSLHQVVSGACPVLILRPRTS